MMPPLKSNSDSRTDQHQQSRSIGEYLIERLQHHGLEDMFGIPGDYVLSFYSLLEQSPINVVGCTREDCAGFAADAYARIRGLGAVCVTYCVGGLSVCNSIAGAFAEKSAVVLISGSPGLGERINNPLLHHKVRDFRTQYEVFEKLCVAGSELSDAATAFREIDRVLDTAVRYKRPVYLEIPRDMVDVVPVEPYTHAALQPTSDPQALGEAVDEAVEMLAHAERPVIVAGVELHRFGLQDSLLTLAENAQIPIAATILGKSVIRETHPLYVGLYEGAVGRAEVTQFVEESDCLLLLGTFMTDLNLGIFTASLDPAKCIYVTSEKLRIRHHHYHDVLLSDFVGELAARDPQTTPRTQQLDAGAACEKFQVEPAAAVTTTRLVALLNERIDENMVVIADIGDSLFAATDLVMRGRTEFISPAYYTSMGFSIPAALGVHVAAPEKRAVVIVGDGAFQMTGMELSSVVRHGYAPVIFVLDNQGYGTERFLHAGHWDYNEIHPWNYHRLPDLLGGGTGYEVRNEAELVHAVDQAWADTSGFSLIHIHINRDDYSVTLGRLVERLSQRV